VGEPEDRHFIGNRLVLDTQGDVAVMTEGTAAEGGQLPQPAGWATELWGESQAAHPHTPPQPPSPAPAGTRRCPTPTQTWGRRGGTVSPFPPGSKETPPAPSSSPHGDCYQQQMVQQTAMLHEHLFTRRGLSISNTCGSVLSKSQRSP